MRSGEQPTFLRDTARRMKWIAGAAITLAVGMIVAAFFVVEVCDQQLASTGSVVTVCRHPSVTDPPIVAVGAVVLALLGVFFSEVSGFGLTLRREVEAAKDTAEKAARDVREAQRSILATREQLREELRQAMTTALRADDSVDSHASRAGGTLPRSGRNIPITQERIAQLQRLASFPTNDELLEARGVVSELTDGGLATLYRLADDMMLSIEMGRRIGQSVATLDAAEELDRLGLIHLAPNYPDDPGFVTLSERGENVARLLTAQGKKPRELADLEERIGRAVASEQPTF
jgi:hypothetical protein